LSRLASSPDQSRRHWKKHSRTGRSRSGERAERGRPPAHQGDGGAAPRLNLEDALAIALFVIEREPHDAERAAGRWLGRLCLERPERTLAEARDAVDAFELLVREPEVADASLHKLAARP
jgi:hypothetical protein